MLHQERAGDRAHLWIHRIIRHGSKTDRDAIKADVVPIYIAPNPAAARLRCAERGENWEHNSTIAPSGDELLPGQCPL